MYQYDQVMRRDEIATSLLETGNSKRALKTFLAEDDKDRKVWQKYRGIKKAQGNWLAFSQAPEPRFWIQFRGIFRRILAVK